MADNDYTSSDDDMNDEDEIPEKDDVEARLEKLLFGDDDGFQAALKSHGQHHGSNDLILASDQEEGDAEDDEGERDMDDVADADVGFSFDHDCIVASLLTGMASTSSFSWTRAFQNFKMRLITPMLWRWS